MVTVSKGFHKALGDYNRKYHTKVHITLADGTLVHIGNLADIPEEYIWQNGIEIEDAVSQEDDLQIGAAICNKAVITLNNIYSTFDEYNFEGAKVEPYVGLEVNGSIEWILKGYFTVDEAVYNGSFIELTCLDRMIRFDKAISKTSFVYPITPYNLVNQACTYCYVQLDAATAARLRAYSGDEFMIKEAPEEGSTFRDAIGWVAGMLGCFARINRSGYLEIKWYNTNNHMWDVYGTYYDGGDFHEYDQEDQLSGGDFITYGSADNAVSGGNYEVLNTVDYIAHTYKHDISVDDVVIGGLRVEIKNNASSESEGSVDYVMYPAIPNEGYIIEITNNPFITSENAITVLGYMWQGFISNGSMIHPPMNGLTFRKANVSHASDPTIEAGDVALVVDHRTKAVYRILVSKTTFTVGEAQTTVSSAQTPSRNSPDRVSSGTKEFIRQQQQISGVYAQIQAAQEDLEEQIANAKGMYETDVTDPQTGATITYIHDRPILNESSAVIMVSSVGVSVTPNYSDGVEDPSLRDWYGLTVDGNLIANILSAHGVNAGWINAGTITVTDNNNNVIFSVDMDNKRVFMSGNAVISTDVVDGTLQDTSWTSYMSQLANQTQTNAVQQAVSQSSANLNSWITNTYAVDQQELDDWMDTTYPLQIQAIQEQIDKKMETYRQNADPSGSWAAASYSTHIGDLWYCTDENSSYYGKYWEWNGNAWNEMIATPPASVMDVIDGKKAIFVSDEPSPPYARGDLWVKATFIKNDVQYNNATLVCIRERTSGTFNISDWDFPDTRTNAAFQCESDIIGFVTGAYSQYFSTVASQSDHSFELFYLASDPSDFYNWDSSAKSLHTYDLWYNTTNGTVSIYTGSAWSSSTTFNVPDILWDKVNKRRKVLCSTTGTMAFTEGDVRIIKSSNTGSHKVKCYTNGEWVDYSYYAQAQIDAYYASVKATNHLFYDSYHSSYGLVISREKINEYTEIASLTAPNIRLTAIGMDVYNGTHLKASYGSDIKLYSLVNNSDVVSVQIDTEGFKMLRGSITLGVSSGTYFSVSTGGLLTAKNADIAGKITASEGEIGGFTITSTSLYSQSSSASSHYKASINKYVTTATHAFEVSNTVSSQTFYVDYTGKLYATNAEIVGKVTATSGKIGNYTIIGDDLQVGSGTTRNDLIITLHGDPDQFWDPSGSGGFYERAPVLSIKRGDLSSYYFFIGALGQVFCGGIDFTAYPNPSTLDARINGCQCVSMKSGNSGILMNGGSISGVYNLTFNSGGSISGVKNIDATGDLHFNGGVYGYDINIDSAISTTSAPGYLSVYKTIDMHGYTIMNQSDMRLKDEIEPSKLNGLDIVDSIAVKSFKWKKNGSKVYAGFIAQDVEALETEFKNSGYETIVTDGEDGYKRITNDKLIPILWKAVQELSSEVKSLRNRYEDK